MGRSLAWPRYKSVTVPLQIRIDATFDRQGDGTFGISVEFPVVSHVRLAAWVIMLASNEDQRRIFLSRNTLRGLDG